MQQFKLNQEQREALTLAVSVVSDFMFQNYFAEDGDWDDRTYAEVLAEKPAFQDMILQVRRQFHPEAKAEQFFIPTKYREVLAEQINDAAKWSLNTRHDDRPFIDQIVETPAFQEIIADVTVDAYVTAEEERKTVQG